MVQFAFWLLWISHASVTFAAALALNVILFPISQHPPPFLLYHMSALTDPAHQSSATFVGSQSSPAHTPDISTRRGWCSGTLFPQSFRWVRWRRERDSRTIGRRRRIPTCACRRRCIL